jgi:integrase
VTAPRRKRGTGSVRHHAPSGLWRATLPKAFDPTEHPEYFTSRAEAVDWLNVELAGGARLAAAPSGGMLLGDYLRSWLVTTGDSADWSPSTRDTQASHAEYLRPLFGRTLASITRGDLQSLVAALQRGSRREYGADGTGGHKLPSGGYVRNVAGTWRRAFASAVDDQLLSRNPAAKLTLPPARVGRRDSWTPAEIRVLAPATVGHPYEAVYAIVFGCGLRIAEARGLAWADVDWDGGRLRIWQQEYKGRGVIQRVKGGEGKWVTAPEPVMLAIERQLDRQDWWGVYVAEHEPGVIASYDVLVKHLKRLAVSVGVRPLTPHAGRHAVGNVLGAAGVPLATISDRLRQRSRTVTADWYLESEQEGEARATELLADLFGSPERAANG